MKVLNQELEEQLRDYLHDLHVQRMKKYIQHGKVTTYDHCISVASTSHFLNQKLHLHANQSELLTGAFLHDFYLYDWHEDDPTHRLHGYHHALTSRNNAIKYFDINENEQHIIYCHMWPLNITRVPHSREAWIVCLADKYVSIYETLFCR